MNTAWKIAEVSGWNHLKGKTVELIAGGIS
jgi:hypothetical protein